MSPYAERHFARERLTERSYKRAHPDYRHSLGHKRVSEPVQAWGKASARLAYVKAHRHIRQRGRVVSYPNGVPME
mgnify:CR=1 FL=1